MLLIGVSTTTMTFQASEEYRERSTHKTQRARKTQQRQNQHVVEQHSTTVQESSTVTTKRSSQQELSKKNFNVIRLNSIPLPLASGGTVTCKSPSLAAVFLKLSTWETYCYFSNVALPFISQSSPERFSLSLSREKLLHNNTSCECVCYLCDWLDTEIRENYNIRNSVQSIYIIRKNRDFFCKSTSMHSWEK